MKRAIVPQWDQGVVVNFSSPMGNFLRSRANPTLRCVSSAGVGMQDTLTKCCGFMVAQEFILIKTVT